MPFPVDLEVFESEVDPDVIERAYDDDVTRDLAEAVEAIERANDRMMDEAEKAAEQWDDDTHDAVLSLMVRLNCTVEDRLHDLEDLEESEVIA